jgi:hypothetical protein
MNDVLLNALEFFGLAWWIEIVTESPNCTYYFGPYILASEAKTARAGFVADLEAEGARGIRVEIKRCKPNDLTRFDEGSEQSSPSGISPIVFSN